MPSGGSDVTLSGRVDEVNRWQKGNIFKLFTNCQELGSERDGGEQSFLQLLSLLRALCATPVVIR